MFKSTGTYENLFRPTYEAVSAAGWVMATLGIVNLGITTDIPASTLLMTSALTVPMAMKRCWETYKLTKFKTELAGNAFWVITVDDLKRFRARHSVPFWFGKGFVWTPTHAQRAYQMMERSLNMVLPHPMLRKLFGNKQIPEQERGESWVHALEPVESDIVPPAKFWEGNTKIFGVTGSGKTRLYETLLFQAVMNGSVVIIIDPKGDKDLEDICKRSCALAGRPDKFLKFHPAFPDQSIRLDPLANFNRITELASRVTDILSDGPKDNFAAFAWRTVYTHAVNMDYLGQAPQMAHILDSIQQNGVPLLKKVLQKFFTTSYPGYLAAVNQILGQKKFESPIRGEPELGAWCQVYEKEVPDRLKITEISNLVSVVKHPAEHTAKMIQIVLPMFTMLTAGTLGKLLSPDADDIDDPRPIMNMSKIVNGGYVLLIGTDSLPDPTVGTALAAVYLADAKAVAGQIYNYQTPKDIILLIDESAEVANDPLIAIANKGRGAGMKLFCASQTFSDWVVKLGSVDKARMAIGNFNNVITLRVRDRNTQTYVAESFGETTIQKISRSITSGSKTQDSGIQFSGNMQEQISRERVPIFPESLIGKLPDLHFMALLGGKIYKGRLPKVG